LVYSRATPPKDLQVILNSQKGIYFEKSFGKLDFYKIPDEDLLPHIYPVATPILVNGSIDEMFKAVTSDNFAIGKSALFLSDQTSKSQWEFLDRYSEAKCILYLVNQGICKFELDCFYAMNF
ncbi:hypothetical protein HKBW3S06_01366, partial [Candidatus Hakubella thermalkaliphila]